MFQQILLFYSFFYITLISVIGYGFLFNKICFASFKSSKNEGIIYVGFYGLFFLTLISLFTSFFTQHDYFHNLIINILGIIFFFFIKFHNKKNYIKIIFIISIFTISALLISKTHDDFSYYHLPFTNYLTEQKVIFGMGNLSHGYKLLSSLFFLNSVFYLPYIELYSFHFSLIFFLIFFNFFLIKEILNERDFDISKCLYLLTFIFFNLSFNRLAEYGTDKAGQLLMVILIIKSLHLICFEKNKKDLNSFVILLPLFALCITLKTYFVSYLIIGLAILLINEKIVKILKDLFLTRSFIFSLTIVLLFFIHHFISTGCIISPISITCLGDNLDWAHNKSHYQRLSNWLEQWAKAGAGPNYRVDDPEIYIKNFNWVDRWFNYYFIGKVKDQLILLFATYLCVFFFLKKLIFNDNKIIFLNLKVIFFYLLILFIIFIWFTNHPQLRYGGYPIIFLFLSIPFVLFLQNFENKKISKKKIIVLIIMVIVIFNYKNFIRINKEFKRVDNYKFDNFPYFSLPKKYYEFENTDSGLKIYKTDGHCWNTPSPCAMSLEKFNFKVKKKNSYYFIINE